MPGLTIAALLLAAQPSAQPAGPGVPPAAPPASAVADTVTRPDQGTATTTNARPSAERTGTGARDGAPGQAHETHGSPNPRNPDPR